MEDDDKTVWQEEYDKYILCEMEIYIPHLIKGTDFHFAEIPRCDKTAILLDGLKQNDFISTDTKLEHFRVLFGIPLHKADTPFERIKWRKNKQLLRFFVQELFSQEAIWRLAFCVSKLFTDKHGECMSMPQSDPKRLRQSSDYAKLVELLKIFKG